MPVFGAHLSVAGGFPKAVAAAVAGGMATVQIFTHSPSQWAIKPRPGSDAGGHADPWVGKPLKADDIAAFRAAVRAANLAFPTAHDSYLINLAAPDDTLYQKSIAAFADEVERAEGLGLTYLVTHPGAHTGSGAAAGIARVVAALDEVHARCPGYRVKVLLETTAGQGTCLGATFEELAAVLDRVADADRVGVCLDTCHVFAAGYSLAADYAGTFQRFDDVIGLDQLALFHVNDSVKPCGSRVDRHAGLGLGEIGLDAFRRLATDPRFRDRPMILETPKEDSEGNPMDAVNLGILRGFVAGDSRLPDGDARPPRP